MKRIALGLALALGMTGGVAALMPVEAGGGGGSYACKDDRDVTGIYESTALEVTVRDACFGPVVAHVAPGTELRWVNRGQMPHNLIDVTKPTDVHALQPGASLTMTFAQAGAFVYYCGFHPGMTGAVFVGDSFEEGDPVIAPVQAPQSLPAASPASAPAASFTRSDESGVVSAPAVLLLSLALGTVAGGGATLLVRRLDQR